MNSVMGSHDPEAPRNHSGVEPGFARATRMWRLSRSLRKRLQPSLNKKVRSVTEFGGGARFANSRLDAFCPCDETPRCSSSAGLKVIADAFGGRLRMSVQSQQLHASSETAGDLSFLFNSMIEKFSTSIWNRTVRCENDEDDVSSSRLGSAIPDRPTAEFSGSRAYWPDSKLL